MSNVNWLTDLQIASTEQLKEWRQSIDSEIKKRESKDRAEARKKIIELAGMHGIDLAALGTGAAGGKQQKSGKYRNPNDQFQTWSGIGRKPRWVQEWLNAGHTLEELEIS